MTDEASKPTKEIGERVKALLEENGYDHKSFARKYFKDFKYGSYSALAGHVRKITEGTLSGKQKESEHSRSKLALLLYKLPGKKRPKLVKDVQEFYRQQKIEFEYPPESDTVEKAKPRPDPTGSEKRKLKPTSLARNKPRKVRKKEDLSDLLLDEDLYDDSWDEEF